MSRWFERNRDYVQKRMVRLELPGNMPKPKTRFMVLDKSRSVVVVSEEDAEDRIR